MKKIITFFTRILILATFINSFILIGEFKTLKEKTEELSNRIESIDKNTKTSLVTILPNIKDLKPAKELKWIK